LHVERFYQLPFRRISYTYEVECTHEPIYLAGRYLKLSRTLPQTAWIIQGERKLATSIEELVGDVIKRELGASGYVFTASGREDIDVKCLGKGRPFIFELHEPKRTQFTWAEMKHLQNVTLLCNSNATRPRDK
jgi:tRNA pseudouridine synthase 10